MIGNLNSFLPQDRRAALARGVALPSRTTGSVLFADISGFTSITEVLRESLGPRHGAEELTRHLDAVYTALVAEVERYDGSVIGFAGDSITCWFDDVRSPAAQRAVACAQALQNAMKAFDAVALPNGATTALALKIAVTTGPARRMVVGDPAIQYLDALTGATVARAAATEHFARSGEVLLDKATVDALGASLTIREWRTGDDGDKPFALVAHFASDVGVPVACEPLPVLDAAALQPWMHGPVYERELSGQSAFLTEFRPCVAFFVRFVGIDFDRDDAGSQLDTLVRRVQRTVARYDGALLEMVIGDKGSYLYVAFGAMSAHEDDARRALKVALSVREDAQDLAFLAPLQMGLAQGTMRVGAYGGQSRRCYGVLGDEVNLAARLMQTATPGEIVVSGAVQRAVEDRFVFEPRPPLRMKGKAEPLPVFAVTGERRGRAMRLQEPAYALPMVGRQAELQAIGVGLDLALKGQAQVIGVVAEAGLGKSRLVAEVIRLARRKGFAGFGGACQSYGVNTPYLVWKPIWSALFGVDPELPLQKQVRLLTAEIEERAPARAQAVPLLGPLLNLSIPDNEFTKSLDPKDRKQALHALLEDSLRAAAKEEPLLLVIEDLHWIDALSCEFLEELARGMSTCRLCFVLAYRPTGVAEPAASRLEALPHFTAFPLTELNAAECGQVVRAKLAQLFPARGGGLPATLVDGLMARTQGNPFYLEELLNFLHDRGLDPHDPAALERVELPDSLHTLILSRIDQGSERQKTTLRVASVIGRSFRVDWLSGYYPALGTSTQVRADLRDLEAQDLTLREVQSAELAYFFKHVITHEAIYESLPFVTRAQLHEQLAQYLESIAAPLDTIAHHYGQSSNLAKQREYWQRAGDAALLGYANDAALTYYARLLPIVAEPSELIDLHFKRGDVLLLVGRSKDAETEYRAVLDLADSVRDSAASARCQQALGVVMCRRGEYDEALGLFEQARARGEALGDRLVTGRALIEKGYVCHRKGRNAEAMRVLGEGLDLARAMGDKRGVALALNYLGQVAHRQGDYARAWKIHGEGLELKREMRDKQGIGLSLNNLALLATDQGNFEAARQLLEESLAHRREVGDKRGIAMTLNNLGTVEIHQGRVDAAWSLHEESLRLSEAVGDKKGAAEALNNLGNAALIRRDSASAKQLFERSLQMSRDLGNRMGVPIPLHNLGNVAMAQGDYPAAWQSFMESLEVSREIEFEFVVAANLAKFATLASRMGDVRCAVHIAAATETLLGTIKAALEPNDRSEFEQTLGAARAALGNTAFDAAWEEGRTLAMDDVIALARNLVATGFHA